MSIEKAKKMATDVAETVVKASGEIIEKSKTKYRIYDAGIDLRRLFEKLGKAVYEDYKNDGTESEKIQNICTEIREKELYIESLSEKAEGDVK